ARGHTIGATDKSGFRCRFKGPDDRIFGKQRGLRNAAAKTFHQVRPAVEAGNEIWTGKILVGNIETLEGDTFRIELSDHKTALGEEIPVVAQKPAGLEIQGTIFELDHLDFLVGESARKPVQHIPFRALDIDLEKIDAGKPVGGHILIARHDMGGNLFNDVDL